MVEHLLDGSAYSDELDCEREAHSRGVARYRRLVAEAVDRGDGAALKPVERLLVHWFRVYSSVIAAEKAAITARRPSKGRRVYGPLLQQLDSATLAVAAMHEALGKCLSEPTGVKVATLSLAIGRSVNAEINYDKLRKENDEAWSALLHTDRKKIKATHVNRIANKFRIGEKWSLRNQCHVGAKLLELLIKVATIADFDQPRDPAFEIFTRRRGVRIVNVTRLTRRAVQLIEDGHSVREHLRPRYQPMLVPPMSWTDQERGGYLELPTELVKKADRSKVKADTETIREAVNALSATPWRINRAVLPIVQALWASGGACAGLPRAGNLPMPPLPADWNENEAAKKLWKREAAGIRRRNAQEQAERIVFKLKLDVAERFADRPAIYFPHQLDFRTRAYPIPLFLHHQGDDICRGLLEFAEARPMAAEGRQWLLVHMANCCGVDKASFDDRIAWATSSLPAIKGWATAPLDNTGWMELDKPWQALAAAIALNNPEAATHLPVQLDGSNNALQHYGAMLRCEQTGRMVNLLPADAPQDVYAKVAAQVAAIVEQEAADGIPEAKLLTGWIDRKIVKQTVMTSVYGVTKVGARRQVYAHLKDAGFDQDDLYAASRYLANKCLAANKIVCVAAHAAMDWLACCGKLIARTGQPIRWTTPLGVVVEQPYRRARVKAVVTMLQSIHFNERDEKCPISPQRQVNGFAPNWVHAMDASHMMCTAIACRDEGLRFAGVHDSYWTHAADVGRMNEILREQFVLLHEEPAHLRLFDELIAEYPDISFPEPPQVGNLDLRAVMASRYFFS